jgi:hypothetical protein
MAFGYKQAFGLSDNPFGPRQQFRTVSDDLTADLETKPLLLHKDKERLLNELYCDTIPSFRDASRKLKIRLEADGYSEDPPARGKSSYAVAILGDRGAGKTTLACRMLQLMLDRTPAGAEPWHVEELLLDSMKDTAIQQSEQLKVLQKRVLDADPKIKFLCVLVDDLLADAFPFAEDLYRTLTGLTSGRRVFFVMTSCDEPKMSAQLAKTLLSVQRYKIDALTPDDVIAYVALRYKTFRVSAANGLGMQPLFPFDEDDLRFAVQVRGWKGQTSTGPVNLRFVSRILFDTLTSRFEQIALDMPEFDALTAPAEKLKELCLKVAKAYEILLRK